jgi:tetratricopeptide (TPR) repeat protein
MKPRAALVAIASAAALATAAAQEHAHHTVPSIPLDVLERPIGLREGIGAAHDVVTTPSTEAQKLYDQGLAYLHSYAWIDAARSFNEALRNDPALALAHVGLSVAYEELNKPAAARAALTTALNNSRDASEHERAHVEIRYVQLAASEVRDDLSKLNAYRSRIDAALAAFPSDAELVLLRGVAEARDAGDRGQGSTSASVAFYERALTLDAGNFAAHHYLTHALENAGRLDDALTHAEHYVRLAPAVPHAHHMRGHNLRRVGRIREAIAEFTRASELEAARDVPPEYDWHYLHNLDLLATSHQYVGQMRTAEELLRKSFGIASPLVVQEFNKHEWLAFLLARGRSNEVLTSAATLTRSPAAVVRAMGHIMSGRAFLAQAKTAEAAAASNAALNELRAAGPEAAMAAPYLQALQAEISLRTGDRSRAAAAFRDVRSKIRALPGPDAWSQGLFRLESIGRTAVALEAWSIAAETAADMTAHDPNYGGTHYLQSLVARNAGDERREQHALQRALEAWRGGDSNFADLADVQRRLARR